MRGVGLLKPAEKPSKQADDGSKEWGRLWGQVRDGGVVRVKGRS